jgi:hypothetical protein
MLGGVAITRNRMASARTARRVAATAEVIWASELMMMIKTIKMMMMDLFP